MCLCETQQFVFVCVQKKSPATPAAEYKKTDEAQPDVKEDEEEEKNSPGASSLTVAFYCPVSAPVLLAPD